MKKYFLLSFIVLGSLFLGVNISLAAGHYVSPSGDNANDGSESTPWKSIQHAIDNSASGDTITVAEGTYIESIVIDKSITLLGGIIDSSKIGTSGHPAILNGESFNTETNAITINNNVNNVTISGFQIQNYYFLNDQQQRRGVGIKVYNEKNSTINISYNLFYNIGGWGIALGSGDDLQSNHYIRYNTFIDAGVKAMNLINLTNSTIEYNNITINQTNTNTDEIIGINFKAYSKNNLITILNNAITHNTINTNFSGQAIKVYTERENNVKNIINGLTINNNEMLASSESNIGLYITTLHEEDEIKNVDIEYNTFNLSSSSSGSYDVNIYSMECNDMISNMSMSKNNFVSTISQGFLSNVQFPIDDNGWGAPYTTQSTTTAPTANGGGGGGGGGVIPAPIITTTTIDDETITTITYDDTIAEETTNEGKTQTSTSTASDKNLLAKTIAEEKALLTTIDYQLSSRLSGGILLQVERNGEAWYVYPDNKKKYFLGRPADAFNIMRFLGLGATHEFITSHTIYPDHVVGKILLDVEENGEAYYIYPKDKKAYYLGRPEDAFQIMRNLGLGITNTDIRKVDIGDVVVK